MAGLVPVVRADPGVTVIPISTTRKKKMIADAMNGCARAQHRLGMCLSKGEGMPKSIPQAIAWLLASAGQGNRDAQYELGSFFCEGSDIIDKEDESEELCIKWWTEAAKQGDVAAQVNLGLLFYDNPNGCDFKRALYWFRMAASRDDAHAQLHLGSMYEMGYGVDQSLESAKYWFKKAARNGDTFAMSVLRERKFLDG